MNHKQTCRYAVGARFARHAEGLRPTNYSGPCRRLRLNHILMLSIPARPFTPST